MPEQLVVWAFLALVQGYGIVGSATESEQQCREAHAEVAADADTLAIGECHELTLRIPEAPKK